MVLPIRPPPRAKPKYLSLHPADARRIENGNYFLFDMPCPTEVMASYERCWARRGSPLQSDIDNLLTWAVEQSLLKGDFQLATQLRDAFEDLGWRSTF